ncbi:MAG: hypothetical protein A4S09_13005 [Proteobacteria bacterium SG_bin7]|nr:MAG: hypothetical protein A4S09_13005 [Proteobacteria bacterium SG_bin7]
MENHFNVARVNELFRDLIPFFMQNRQTELVDLEKWLAAKDFSSIARLGHKLYGSGATYGFLLLAQLARQLESAGQRLDGESVQKIIGDIRNHIENVKVEFISHSSADPSLY